MVLDGVPKREYPKRLYKYVMEFLEVIKGDTSLKLYLARNFPSLYRIRKIKRGERLKWKEISFVTHRDIEFVKFSSDACFILFGFYSIPECKVEEGDIVFDVGAHYGFFSLYASNNKAEKVYAFEPNPYVFEILKKHIELWKVNIEAYNFAFYSENCKKKLFIEGKKLGVAATLLKERKETKIENTNYEEAIEVECRTIDDFVNEKGIEVDFIKINAEGSEREILLGAKETIRRFKPKIVVSAHHRPDDHEVIPKIVKSIRDDYKYKQDDRFNIYSKKSDANLFFF